MGNSRQVTRLDTVQVTVKSIVKSNIYTVDTLQEKVLFILYQNILHTEH